jgi:acyl-CoA dehydrogenase
MPTKATDLLLNPSTYDPAHFDAETRRLLRAAIDWFEQRGEGQLLADFFGHVYHADFNEFVAKEHVFATMLTPARNAAGDPDKRWDTARIAAMSELLGFYGISYWYPWQVTVLGLGPVWQSDNESARARAAAALEAGGQAAFGLSEQTHGADIYSTDMVLTPDGNGGYTASGSKYYIGNGNIARTVSVFGRVAGVEGPDQYVWFYADSNHDAFTVVKNVVPLSIYVSEFKLTDYPVAAEDIMHTGEDAFSAALNTVNVGKFNLCFGSVGLATHALYEAITHASNRILYGQPVTAMAHIQRAFIDAYARLIAMKLFSDRAVDYFRTASPEDRRYLLFNPVTKMKVTTEGETAIGLLGDIVAAKGFEADSFVTVAKMEAGALPRLEGTVAVNLALVLKFMPAYLFQPMEYAPVPTRLDASDDDFLFRQGPTRGLGKIRFHDWRTAYAAASDIPNVAAFTDQAESFAKMVAGIDQSAPSDLDAQLAVGELFTLIVYGQLILEQAKLIDLEEDIVNTIFDVLIRDFSERAISLHGKAMSTPAMQEWALSVVRKPVADAAQTERVWQQVAGLSGAYKMNP